MRTKINRIWPHFLALGASVALNAALVQGFLDSKAVQWPAVFAPASAKSDLQPSAAMPQPSTEPVERIVVIARRPGATTGVAMAQVPTQRSRDCPVPL